MLSRNNDSTKKKSELRVWPREAVVRVLSLEQDTLGSVGSMVSLSHSIKHSKLLGRKILSGLYTLNI